MKKLIIATKDTEKNDKNHSIEIRTFTTKEAAIDDSKEYEIFFIDSETDYGWYTKRDEKLYSLEYNNHLLDNIRNLSDKVFGAYKSATSNTITLKYNGISPEVQKDFFSFIKKS